MNIAFFEVEPWEKTFLEERFKGHDCIFSEDTLTAESIARAGCADIVSVFVYSKVDAAVFDACPSIKLVSTRSMGYDHIDVAEAEKRGITVTRVPAYGERTVAEHAFGLILGLSRKIYTAYERTERHEFDYRGLQGFDLFGKTLGIIGCGKIGATAARIAAKGFGMRVLVSDPNRDDALAKDIGFAYVDNDTLFAESDIVTLHAPLLKETHHMVNAESIAKMKDGVLLVNTARGALIDTYALLAGLESGKIAGAGLDVLEEECAYKEEAEMMTRDFPNRCDPQALLRNHMLVKRDDVIITPHIAFNSKEATAKILHTTATNIETFIRGGTPETAL